MSAGHVLRQWSFGDESRTVPWTAIGEIGLGLFGLGLAVGGYGAYVSALIARGVSPDAAGFGMSLFLLGQLLVVVPADRLTRTAPVERVAALRFAVAGVGIALGGAVTLEATYVSRLLLGLGQGTAFVGGMKYVGLRTTGADTATAQGCSARYSRSDWPVDWQWVPSPSPRSDRRSPPLSRLSWLSQEAR